MSFVRPPAALVNALESSHLLDELLEDARLMNAFGNSNPLDELPEAAGFLGFFLLWRVRDELSARLFETLSIIQMFI